MLVEKLKKLPTSGKFTLIWEFEGGIFTKTFEYRDGQRYEYSDVTGGFVKSLGTVLNSKLNPIVIRLPVVKEEPTYIEL